MSAKMSKSSRKQLSILRLPLQPMFDRSDRYECPFREFKDNELNPETWGLNHLKKTENKVKGTKGKGSPGIKSQNAIKTSKLPPSASTNSWVDDQIQPLPRSVRFYLDRWVRAQDLALERWNCAVLAAETEPKLDKITIMEYQLSHTQVLQRSAFCRKVLSACYILERVENIVVEHHWELFNCALGPEGWRPRYHVYSPGMKPGGGSAHRPTLSKNGCYLVRLYWLGAWRCVWVSDLVPVDASGAPLLPFSPISSPNPIKAKGVPSVLTATNVLLWPLLLCKAILKLAAPDMNADYFDSDDHALVIDERMDDFEIMHCLTGGLCVNHYTRDYNEIWSFLTRDAPVFTWPEEEIVGSSIKLKGAKKVNPKDKEKETTSRKGESLVCINIDDSKDIPPYAVQGIAPTCETMLYVSLVRDLPLKRPLPEPEVPRWKLVRWVAWAKAKGLYAAYECPRTKYLKMTCLLKLMYAPHLLDVQSTESLAMSFKEEQEKTKMSSKKEAPNKTTVVQNKEALKEELREWVLYDNIQPLINCVKVVYCPSTLDFTSATSMKSTRLPPKLGINRIGVLKPTTVPLYFQIDGPEENNVKISLNVLHPNVVKNCGMGFPGFCPKTYIFLEYFEWFTDSKLPLAKAFLRTRCYDSVEITFPPGRHYCRLWASTPTNWYAAMVSGSSRIILGTRDVIMAYSNTQCDWTSKFLSNLSITFGNLIRKKQSNAYIADREKEFYTSYQPDLHWDADKIGYHKKYLHWMFRQALQAHLHKRLSQSEFYAVCVIFRRLFLDPEFGMTPKALLPPNYRDIVSKEPCECVLPEAEEVPEQENLSEEEQSQQQPKQLAYEDEQRENLVTKEMMEKLLTEPEENKSHVCDMATEELSCAFLKKERSTWLRKHEAAIMIQKTWRGSFARKSLIMNVDVTNEMYKLLSDHVFGPTEVLTSLMNEFFTMFPGTSSAFSVSSGLTGIHGLQQFSGTVPVTLSCKWIPYFQGVFYCHYPVKVHFDLLSAIEHTCVLVYDNDSGKQLPHVYSAHITYDIQPNLFGYTVMGHGSLFKPIETVTEVNWQLTVLTSLDKVFHHCDNKEEQCTITPLHQSMKLNFRELFLPNRRNILGGLQLSVSSVESISFRAECTNDTLEIEAVVRIKNAHGEMAEIGRCKGKGEIFWPYLNLQPNVAYSRASFHATSYPWSPKSRPSSTTPSSARSLKKDDKRKKSPLLSYATKSRVQLAQPEPKIYTIELTAPEGWPIPLVQWRRIVEAQNAVQQSFQSPPTTAEKDNKITKTKDKREISSAKSMRPQSNEDKLKQETVKPASFIVIEPKPEDAFTVFECAVAINGGVYIKRDDTRDILFATTVKNWNIEDPMRPSKGAEFREQFLEEFLVPEPKINTDSYPSEMEGEFEENYSRLATKSSGGVRSSRSDNRNTPVSESGADLESLEETEEERLYYTMPEALRAKLLPLDFIEECTKEQSGEAPVLFTEDMMEAAKAERSGRYEAATRRMEELQSHNEQILLQQKNRIYLLSELEVDATWCDEICDAFFPQINEAIMKEVAEQQAAKKLAQKDVKEEKEKDKGKKKGNRDTKKKK